MACFHRPTDTSARESPLDELDWLNILFVSDYLGSHEARRQAVAQLSAKNASIRPSKKLFLGLRFTIHVWIRPALVSILQTPTTRFTQDDWTNIAFCHDQAIQELSAAQTAITKNRHSLIILSPPAVHVPTCADGTHRRSCEQSWKDVWGAGMKYLISTEGFYTGQMVLAEIENLALRPRVAGRTVSRACLEASLDYAREREFLWRREEELVEEGMQAVLGKFNYPMIALFHDDPSISQPRDD